MAENNPVTEERQALVDQMKAATTFQERASLFFKLVGLAGKTEWMEIHGHEFPMVTRSGCSQEGCRVEEDYMNARESLEDLVDDENHPFAKQAGLDTWQKRLMYFLKPTARHYGLDDEILLQKYMRHNMPTHMMEAGVDPIPWLEATL
jgi:hypothetical protein